MTEWNPQKRDREARLQAGRRFAKGKLVASDDATKLLEAIVRPGDRVCLEGDNQKQADFLAGALAKADKAKVHDLHIVQSGIVLAEHLDLFEKGIATKLDYSYSGPQSEAVARWTGTPRHGRTCISSAATAAWPRTACSVRWPAFTLRPLHRRDAADRPRRQQLDGDAIAHRGLWGGAQHGL